MLTYIGFVWKPVFTEIHQYNKEFLKKGKKSSIYMCEGCYHGTQRDQYISTLYINVT